MQFANTPSQRPVYSGIIVEAMREHWTDARLDDLAKRMDIGFAQVHEDVAALRVDNKELQRDMATLDRNLRAEIGQLATREELHALNNRFDGRFDALNKRFDDLQRTLIAAVLAGLIGLLATHFG
jgi:hypothetical protein